MRSAAYQVADAYVNGKTSLNSVISWAEQFGRKRFDPADTESLYISALVMGLKAEGALESTIKEELARGLDVEDTGAVL